MAFKKITRNVEVIQTLPDKPYLDAQVLKEQFDTGSKIIKEDFNELSSELDQYNTYVDGNFSPKARKNIVVGDELQNQTLYFDFGSLTYNDLHSNTYIIYIDENHYIKTTLKSDSEAGIVLKDGNVNKTLFTITNDDVITVNQEYYTMSSSCGDVTEINDSYTEYTKCYINDEDKTLSNLANIQTIGDNLTLTNGRLDASGGGSTPIYYWDKTTGTDSKTLFTNLIDKYRNNESFILFVKYHDSTSNKDLTNLCLLAIPSNINGTAYVFEITARNYIIHLRHDITISNYEVTNISLNTSALYNYNDYEELINLPAINSVTIMGDVTTSDLGLQDEITSSNKLDYSLLSNTPTIPDELSDLSDDSTHRLVTDTEKSTWNGKSDFSGSYNDLSNKPTIPINSDFTLNGLSEKSYTNLTDKPTIPTNSDFTLNGLSEKSYTNLTDKPTIPTALSDLSDDSTHRVVTDTEKTTWSGKQDALSSGTNIKTINNESILGSGNITVGGGGTATDVQINGTSIVSSNTANIITESTYDSSTNKIATMSDVPRAKSSIKLKLSTNKSFSSKNAQKLTLSLDTSTGSNLTLSDGGVKIGAGITHVYVSGQVYFYTGSNHADGKVCRIVKNTTTMCNFHCRTNLNYIHVGASTIVPVQENDIIYLYCINNTTNASVIQNGSDNTFLNVIEL